MTVPFATPDQRQLHLERAWRAFDLAADEERDGPAWEQGSYRTWCGTGCCYAGLLAVAENRPWLTEHAPDIDGPTIDGVPVTWTEYDHLRYGAVPHEYLIAAPDDPEKYIEEMRGKRIIHVRHAAAYLLGLDPDGYHALEDGLFAEDNDIDDLERLITEQIGPRPAKPEGNPS
jgi:hypothetical protein